MEIKQCERFKYKINMENLFSLITFKFFITLEVSFCIFLPVLSCLKCKYLTRINEKVNFIEEMMNKTYGCEHFTGKIICINV